MNIKEKIQQITQILIYKVISFELSHVSEDHVVSLSYFWIFWIRETKLSMTNISISWGRLHLHHRLRKQTFIALKNKDFPEFKHIHLDVENSELASSRYVKKAESRIFGKCFSILSDSTTKYVHYFFVN